MSDIPSLMFEEAPPVPETFNVLLYGPPKSGKSTAAATAPGPILWVNAEGPNALGFARKVARERGTDILEVRIGRRDDAQSILRQILSHVLRGEEPQPATVVVDTMAKVRESLIRRIVVPGSKNSLNQYGEVTRILREFVVSLRDAPVNAVFIAHQEIVEAEGDRTIEPLIGGALTSEVPGEVDVLAYTHSFKDEETGERRWVGQLAEAKGRNAGDRSGGLRPVEDLDLSAWLETYRAALTPDESDLPFTVGEAEGEQPAGEPDQPPADQTELETGDEPVEGQPGNAIEPDLPVGVAPAAQHQTKRKAA